MQEWDISDIPVVCWREEREREWSGERICEFYDLEEKETKEKAKDLECLWGWRWSSFGKISELGEWRDGEEAEATSVSKQFFPEKEKGVHVDVADSDRFKFLVCALTWHVVKCAKHEDSFAEFC